VTKPKTTIDILNHETGHACAAIWCGLRVLELRVDRPDDYLGLCTVAVEPGPPFELLCFTLGGPIGERRPLMWPPRRNAKNVDEARAAMFVARLGMTENEWNDAHALVLDVLTQPTVRRAGLALAAALEESPRLDGETVHRIYDDACALGAGVR
jgi:hypothetical protein